MKRIITNITKKTNKQKNPNQQDNNKKEEERKKERKKQVYPAALSRHRHARLLAFSRLLLSHRNVSRVLVSYTQHREAHHPRQRKTSNSTLKGTENNGGEEM